MTWPSARALIYNRSMFAQIPIYNNKTISARWKNYTQNESPTTGVSNQQVTRLLLVTRILITKYPYHSNSQFFEEWYCMENNQRTKCVCQQLLAGMLRGIRINQAHHVMVSLSLVPMIDAVDYRILYHINCHSWSWMCPCTRFVSCSFSVDYKFHFVIGTLTLMHLSE